MKLRKRPEALKWEQAYEFGDMKKKNVALAVRERNASIRRSTGKKYKSCNAL